MGWVPALAALRRGDRDARQDRPCRRTHAGHPRRKPNPAVTEPPSELLESLQELVCGRLAASDERTALLNPLGASKTKCLVRELNRQLRALARRFEILVSIPGVGETTAAATIVELQEIGTLSAKETPCSAASLRSPATPARPTAPVTSGGAVGARVTLSTCRPKAPPGTTPISEPSMTCQ